MSFTTPLRRDRRGIAALEFALALPVLLLVMGTLIDVGLIWRARGKLAVAVEAGEQYAVLTGTTATVTNMVNAICAAAATISTSCGVTGTPAPVIVVAASAPTCGCVSTTSGVSTLTATSCGTTCAAGATAGGGTAGSFLKLSASYTYAPITLTGVGSPGTVTEQSWVRLQ
jgi:Flp pilus assembly protein TadG